MKSSFISIICFLFLLSSCNDSKNKKVSVTALKKEKKYQPIFLGLNPHMSENEFSVKINELNKSGKLDHGKFPLLVDGEEFLFEINKNMNSIKLSYTDNYNIQKKCITPLFYKINDKEFSDKRIKFNKYKNKFLKILNKKYKLNKFQIPPDIDEEKIGLEYSDGYKIFIDKNKYVIFGSSIYGLEDFLTKTGIKYKKDDEDDVFDKMITTHTYGMKLWIYYFPIKEFENKLFKEIKLHNQRVKLEKNKKKVKAQNINEL